MRPMIRHASLIAIALAALTSCAPLGPTVRPPYEVKTGVGGPATGPGGPTRTSTTIEPAPEAPIGGATAGGKQAGPGVLADLPDEPANIYLNFEAVPLPTLIQAVYVDVLKRSVNIDPVVQQRRDLVTLRTGKPQSPRQTAAIMDVLLRTYGVAVLDVGGLVRIVPDVQGASIFPEIRRGRALPDTPQPLRPVYQLIELSAVRNIDVATVIRTMFEKRVTLLEDTNRNAVLLYGKSDDVASAAEVIGVLDQPLMKGRHSLRVNPVYWSSDDLVRKLNEVLQAEGYSIGPLTVGTQYPISLISVPTVNAVLVFTSEQKIATHVADWARNLDRPNERNVGRNYFSYQVQNTDATQLATTLQSLLTGVTVASSGARPGGGVAPPPGAPPGQTTTISRATNVVVDRPTNSLIFSVNPDEYPQIVSLLQQLDRPSRQALIEVTVAELQLTDDSEIGVEWLIKNLRLDGTGIVAGTLGGLGLGTSGFSLTWTGANPTRVVVLNALADNNRTSILSNPSVLARNGETATIEVGQEVPIVTSQQSNLSATTNPNNPGVLQTIQYRNTGVILKVTPIIHSGELIDLDIEQEVSEAQSTTTGVNTSPTIATRKVNTKLTLRNGATVLLGGLISNENTFGDTGIPYLKDIPIIGQLFKKSKTSYIKRELIIIITPYIISGDDDARAVTEAFRKNLSPWSQPVYPSSWNPPPGWGTWTVPGPTFTTPTGPGTPAPSGAKTLPPNVEKGGAPTNGAENAPVPAKKPETSDTPAAPVPPADKPAAAEGTPGGNPPQN